MPDTVTELGAGAFASTPLTKVVLSKGLTEIPDECFSKCRELKSVQLPTGITSIGEDAFMHCSSLATINFPEGLLRIGDGAFAQFENGVRGMFEMYRGKRTLTSLKTLAFPASLQSIGKDAFMACDALSKVTFANGSQLQTIPDYSFSLCLSLTEIVLPDSVQSIGEYAFVNCIKLKKIDLGNSVKRIGSCAFMYCGSLTTLDVPDTVQEIGEEVLEGHGKKLIVICNKGSAMERYIQESGIDVTIKAPKN